MTSDTPLSSWQEWLSSADEFLSFEMWEDLDKTLKSTQTSFESALHLQSTGALLAYLVSMLLASVKEPEADKALQTIRDHMLTIKPEIPKRKVKAGVRKAYTGYVNGLAPLLATGGKLFYAAFSAYRQDDYDLQSDPNLLIREALEILDDEKAMRAISQALIIVMRGGKMWNGWTTEGDELSIPWITIMFLVQQFFPLIPLGSVAEERLRVDERLTKLQPDASQTPSVEEVADALSSMGMQPAEATDEMGEDELMQQWAPLIARRDPLTDAEIEDMGERYEKCVDQALGILATIALTEKWDVDDIQAVTTFAHGLGILRYRKDAAAVNSLIDVLPSVGDLPETVDEITWALEQMAPVSTQALMDMVRYTLDSDKFSIAAETLARVGCGDEGVHQFLAERYQATHDEVEKLDLIAALGLLHDERLLPLLVQALRASAGDEDETAAVLDALTEMDAPMTVDAGAGSVTIDGYGEIKEIVPDWWAPEKMDDEEDQEAADEFGDENDTIDLDELFPDDDDEEGDKLYVDDDGERSNPPANTASFGPIHVEHIGRNDPCPCGSGKKYKHCHGKNA